MDDTFTSKYAIPYSKGKHPLINAKEPVRIAYLSLLTDFFHKYSDGDDGARLRFLQFCSHLFFGIQAEKNDVSAQDVFKTRFRPIHFYTYRYQFLFDCIFLFAPTNRELAMKILQDVISHNKAKYQAKLAEVLEGMFSNYLCPAKLGIADELWQDWVNTQDYLKTQERRVVFTATMSAGKSTLINAIIGQELSYAKKAACTSTRMEFVSAAPIAYQNYHIQTNSETLLEQTSEQVRAFTQGRTEPCTVLGYFQSPLGKRKVKLIDTPGVDSSQNPKHKEIAHKVLEKGDNNLLVYVIPVENYGSEDDFEHLTYVKNHTPYNKIIFAINMMDSCNYEDDSNAEIIESVREHLKTIGFVEPLICPLSAKAGGLMKAKLSGLTLSDSEETDLKEYIRMYELPEYDLSSFYEVDPVRDAVLPGPNAADTEAKKTLKKVYLATGLPELEALILKSIEEE